MIFSRSSSIALHMLIIKRKYHQCKARNFSAIDGLNDKNALQESKEIVHSADVVLQVLHNRCTVDQVRVLGIKCHSQQSLWIISTLLLSSFAVMQFAILGKSSFA